MSTHKTFDFFLQMHLTEKCNLSCRHCYQDGSMTTEMDLGEIRKAIREVADTLSAWREAYGVGFTPSANVTGGEPLLRKDLFEVLDEFRSSGFETHVLSNGILITREKAAKLRMAGVRGVQVSIEGTRQIHESIRGENSFQSSLRGVRNLLDEGLEVTLNVTLSRLNADCLPDMIRLSTDLGVHRMGFSRLVPSGRGKFMARDMLGTQDIAHLYERIFSIHTGGVKIVTGDPVASQMRNSNGSHGNKGDIPIGGCAAGVSGLTILPDGTLLPCRRLPVPIGNIRRDSFRNVWATSGVLNALRSRRKYKGKCASCRKWADCRGCRAIAYAYSALDGKGDVLAEDPQCFL